MTQVHKPPAGFKARTEEGFAWCPHCGAEHPFGWDERVGYARCMECGTTEREFYVRTFNGLWQDGPMASFVRAVQRSGRRYAKPFSWEKKEPDREVRKPAGAGELAGAGEAEARRSAEVIAVKDCLACGRIFRPASNRQAYCPACAAKRRKESVRQAVERHRRKKR